MPFPPMEIILSRDVVMATCTFMDRPMACGRRYQITSIILVKYDTFLYYIISLLIIFCFSPSGRMLLVTSHDHTASIWNVPSGTTWPTTPHVTLKGHSHKVRGGAFLGDESHVITGSYDYSLLIWRTSDGVQTAKYECGMVCHALSIYIAYPFCYAGDVIVI